MQVLCDFGLARVVEDAHGRHADPVLQGTIHYMSVSNQHCCSPCVAHAVPASAMRRAPELYDPAALKSAKTDVWSLGATLLHMLTGAPPYKSLKAHGEIMSEVGCQSRYR